MTIAVSLKVADGVVLASDSAATMLLVDPTTGAVVSSRVYNNANKIVNLRKGLPIGAMSWGLGSIGRNSIATLMKDLRERFTSPSKPHLSWKLSPKSYSIEAVASRTCDFFHGEHIRSTLKAGTTDGLGMGILVAGFSPGDGFAELCMITIEDNGDCQGPVLVSEKSEPDQLVWNGQPEAIHRLVVGFSADLPYALQQHANLDGPTLTALMPLLQSSLQAPIWDPAMSIQDAIDLAEFLAEVSAKFSHFMPGLDSVGGPIEVAAITKHEGFKWIKRKYYYDRLLNPREEE